MDRFKRKSNKAMTYAKVSKCSTKEQQKIKGANYRLKRNANQTSNTIFSPCLLLKLSGFKNHYSREICSFFLKFGKTKD